MNRFSSHPNHENHPPYDGPPLQGLFRDTGGREFFDLVTEPRGGGVLSGTATFIVPDR